MINKTKNHVYIIEISYLFDNGSEGLKTGKRTFTSNHSISSKEFDRFLKRKLSDIKGFRMLCDDWGTQYTVPFTDFCQ